LEIRAPDFGDLGLVPSVSRWRLPWSRFLVCRPTTRVLNLVRKEFHLQKAIVQLACVFALCWGCVLFLQWLRPRQDITYLFDVITSLYVPVCSLLAGCISLGEEKALGLTSAQLALPFSPVLQWFLKLAVSVGSAAVLSLGLPIMLFWVTGCGLDL